MKTKLRQTLIAISLASLTSLGLAQSASQNSSLTRATELRADKLGSAAVLAPLAVGASVQVLSLEGGWAQVKAGSQIGWVRASSLALSSGASSASTLSAGREAKGNVALTLGVRSLGSRSNRHALIIDIGRYAGSNIPELPGTRADRESATQMASAMQVPANNITYLQDSEATGDGIREALKNLNERVADGDRVFIHYSGHGTRYMDASAGGCVEALLAYDGNEWKGMISNKEMATLLSPITQKTDKLFVMYDACHSGGVISNASVARTRGLFNKNDEGALRPKFAAISEECGKPTNIKTRNLLVEAVAQNALPQDIVHLSSSRNDEVSFDDSEKGGLATEFVRDCMLRDAKDLDSSGAISMGEIQACAQAKINNRMKDDPTYKAPNIALTGNADFVPAWFSQAAIAQAAPVSVPEVTSALAAAPAVAIVAPVATATPTATATPVATAAPVVVVPAIVPTIVPPLTGEQALHRLFDQRDGKRKVAINAKNTQLQIGKDTLDFSVTSAKAGYVYVALAGSDNESLYMLFPNDLDKDNRIAAGQTMMLPRANWKVRAQGPAGADTLLVMVADGPRDLTSLAKSKAGPFITTLNNTDGRAELGALLTNSGAAAGNICSNNAARKNNPACSDAFGAALLKVDEVK
jgi:Caspase domain/Domain of unknown function (DUF4384)